MADWKEQLPEAAQNYLKDRNLDEVECIIPDLPGIARGKAVPASKFARQDSFHLPDSIFYQTITGNWGEAAGDEVGGGHRGDHRRDVAEVQHVVSSLCVCVCVCV